MSRSAVCAPESIHQSPDMATDVSKVVGGGHSDGHNRVARSSYSEERLWPQWPRLDRRARHVRRPVGARAATGPVPAEAASPVCAAAVAEEVQEDSLLYWVKVLDHAVAGFASRGGAVLAVTL